MIIPALPGSIWHYKSYRLHFLRHSSNVPVKEDSEAFTIIREANVLSELNRSTYSSEDVRILVDCSDSCCSAL